MNELEKAHNDYEFRKLAIINNLELLIKYNSLVAESARKTYDKVINDAIEFIKEKEI